MNAADAHLAKDPVMAGLIERFGGPLVHEEDGEPRTDLSLTAAADLHRCMLGRSPASSSP